MVLLLIIGIIAVVIVFVVMNSKSSKKEEFVVNPSKTPDSTSNEPTDEELIANAKKLAAMGEALQQAKAHGDEKTVQEILNMTYTGPLPEKKEDGTYTQLY
jgi:FtsZ-interacting cell division protein ZipA